MHDGGRQPSVKDDLQWRTTFGGRRPSVEDDLLWKTTFGGRRPLRSQITRSYSFGTVGVWLVGVLVQLKWLWVDRAKVTSDRSAIAQYWNMVVGSQISQKYSLLILNEVNPSFSSSFSWVWLIQRFSEKFKFTSSRIHFSFTGFIDGHKHTAIKFCLGFKKK